ARVERRAALDRLADAYIADGQRLASDGDLFGALPRLALAQRYSATGSPQAEMNVLRLARTAEAAPRLAGVWQLKQRPHIWPAITGVMSFTRDSRSLAVAVSGKGGILLEIPMYSGPVRQFRPDAPGTALAPGPAARLLAG